MKLKKINFFCWFVRCCKFVGQLFDIRVYMYAQSHSQIIGKIKQMRRYFQWRSELLTRTKREKKHPLTGIMNEQ